MMLTVMSPKYYTESEYLVMERAAPYKSRYYKGDISAMAGAGYNHNRITQNLSMEIGAFFKGKSCRTFSSDMRMHIPSNSLYTYPDFMIVCGRNEFLDSKKDTLLNPSVIIEVLSDSTEAYDRGEKFHLYRSIASLREYVMIDSRKIAAEVFSKDAEGAWRLSSDVRDSDASVTIGSVALTLRLAAIYEDTEDIDGL